MSYYGYRVNLYGLPLTFTLTTVCARRVHTSTVQQCTVGYHDWKIDTGKVFTRFSQEWSFGISCPGRQVKQSYSGGEGADKMPTATKKWQLA